MRVVGLGWHEQIGHLENITDLAKEKSEPLFGIAALGNFEDLGKLRQFVQLTTKLAQVVGNDWHFFARITRSEFGGSDSHEVGVLMETDIDLAKSDVPDGPEPELF